HVWKEPRFRWYLFFVCGPDRLYLLGIRRGAHLCFVGQLADHQVLLLSMSHLVIQDFFELSGITLLYFRLRYIQLAILVESVSAGHRCIIKRHHLHWRLMGLLSSSIHDSLKLFGPSSGRGFHDLSLTI